jgi:glycosyltransferase involved in cell wall biosynthesis
MSKLNILDNFDWELIIINNGSTDNTENIISKFSNQLPIRHVFEPTAGLSNARNRAIEESRGEYIIWTDDDVLVDENWLAAYVDAFLTHPDAAVFGGKILPNLTPPTPKWFSDSLPLLSGLIAYRDFGSVPIYLSDDVVPYGANYAVRMKEHRQIRYRSDLGVSPDHRRMGEETTLIISMLKNGCKGVWVPQSIVLHCIPPARQTISYVFRYHRSAGETAAFLEPTYECKKWFYIPRWLWLRMAKRFFCYHRDRIIKRPEQWVQSLIYYAYDRGTADHWRNLALKSSKNFYEGL